MRNMCLVVNQFRLRKRRPRGRRVVHGTVLPVDQTLLDHGLEYLELPQFIVRIWEGTVQNELRSALLHVPNVR